MSGGAQTILLTMGVGWLMLVAGFGKRRLEPRSKACPRCGHRHCVCGSRH